MNPVKGISGSPVFTVAASNSPTLLKSRADYVCDGTNDGVEINTALALGDTFLLPGDFNINVATNPITIPSNNLTLSGSGKSTVVKYNAGTSGFKLIIADTLSGLTLKNFSIDGGNNTNAQYGVYFHKVGSGSGKTAVRGFTIDSLWITGMKQTGIELVGSMNGNIVNCSMLFDNSDTANWYFDGVTCRKDPNDSTVTKGIVIANNVFLNNTAPVWLVGAQLIDIVGNYMEGDNTNSHGQIGVQADTSSNGVTIVGNTIVDMYDDSFYIYNGCYNFLIANNFCIGGHVDHSIFIEECTNVTVENNHVINAWRDGIAFSSCDNCTARNNTVLAASQEADNTYSGIVAYGSDDMNFSNNKVRKGANTNKPKYGILLNSSSVDRCMVHGNDLYTSGSTGDLQDNGTGTLKRDNKSNTGTWLTDN